MSLAAVYIKHRLPRVLIAFRLGAGDREGDSGYADEFLQLPGLRAWLGAKRTVDRCFTCWVDLTKLIFPGSDLELGEGHIHSLSLHRNIDLMSAICGI